jgi:hypothetical protein
MPDDSTRQPATKQVEARGVATGRGATKAAPGVMLPILSGHALEAYNEHVAPKLARRRLPTVAELDAAHQAVYAPPESIPGINRSRNGLRLQLNKAGLTVPQSGDVLWGEVRALPHNRERLLKSGPSKNRSNKTVLKNGFI